MLLVPEPCDCSSSHKLLWFHRLDNKIINHDHKHYFIKPVNTFPVSSELDVSEQAHVLHVWYGCLKK